MKHEHHPTQLFHHDGNESNLLRELFRTQQALIHSFSKRTGVPASRFAVLRLLAHAYPKTCGVMELSRQLDVNAAAVTRHVHALEAEGLVAWAASIGDARKRPLVLTKKGVAYVRAAHSRLHSFESMLDAELGMDEIQITISVLTRLRALLDLKEREE